MKVVFVASDKPREAVLGEAFVAGARSHGHDAEVTRRPDGGVPPADVVDADVVAMVGVKSAAMFAANMRMGRTCLMFDKGYSRHRKDGARTWEYWRVAVNAHQPTRYLPAMRMPNDRWRALGVDVRPWRQRGAHIVLAGSSAKYHAFHGLHDPTRYAAKVAGQIRHLTNRTVIYRPKPSWRDAVPISGTVYSGAQQSMADVLHNAWALVTHGSNACFEAMIAGVPCVVLGDAVARPISSTALQEINLPRLAEHVDRMQLLANLAYCQWTVSELASGAAWPSIQWAMFQ